MFLRYASKSGYVVLKEAFRIAILNKRTTFIQNFIQSPAVLIGLLVVAWGWSFLIKLMDPFYLPSSIITCLFLFLVMCLLSWLSPAEFDEDGHPVERKRFVAPVLAVIEKPCSLILQHMAVCFTPSFILIPSGRALPGRDVGLLIGWFLVSFIAAFVISILIHRAGGYLPFFAEKVPVPDLEAQETEKTPPPPAPRPSPLQSILELPLDRNLPYERDLGKAEEDELSARDWSRKGSDATMVSLSGQLDAAAKKMFGWEAKSEKDGVEVSTKEVYSRRGSVSGLTPLDSGAATPQPNFSRRGSISALTPLDGGIAVPQPAYTRRGSVSGLSAVDARVLAAPRRSREFDAITLIDEVTGDPLTTGSDSSSPLALTRVPTPFPSSPTNADLTDIATRDRLVANLSSSIDIALYLTIFIISLPIFYATRCTVPLFLSLNIATYLVVIKGIPKPWQRYLHPILVTSFISFFLIWAFGSSLGLTLQETLGQYSTGAGYEEMWSIKTRPEGRSPGAGDLLVDGLDAGVIALALPLYRYRADLRKYFFRMLFLVLPSAALALFVWPLGAVAFGLEPAVSLAFVGRFASTPLAVAQVERLQGDGQLTVVIVVVTGIVVVILRPAIFWCLRIKESDFLATGLLFGVTSGAIGATGLLNSGQPRAAAIASLCFALYGTVLLVAIGIPPVAMFVQRLIGL